jgi:hypothetical protein
MEYPMMNKILAGAIALGLAAGLAHAASDQATPPAPPPPSEAQGQMPGQDGPWAWWNHRGHGHHDRQGMMQGGPGMMQGGPGMMPPGGAGGPGMMHPQGFRLTLGPNISVGLMCGTQAMKDCIAEAQPLIDAAKAAAAGTK